VKPSEFSKQHLHGYFPRQNNIVKPLLFASLLLLAQELAIIKNMYLPMAIFDGKNIAVHFYISAHAFVVNIVLQVLMSFGGSFR